jgi:hypothetical protein
MQTIFFQCGRQLNAFANLNQRSTLFSLSKTNDIFVGLLHITIDYNR